jgi:putative FmdB family regulatory protein
MPFYEYECQNCKFYTELMQKISDPPLEKCPSCGKKAMQKLISAPNFRLKGGGWYETDFKGDTENKRNLAGADKEESKPEPSADSAKAADTKTEAKPAAAESKPAAEPKRQGSSSGSRSHARPAAPAKAAAPAKSKSKQAAKAASKPAMRGKPKPKAKGKAGKGRR